MHLRTWAAWAAERWDRLSVFPGVPGPELLAADPVQVAVRAPRDERTAMLADLDGDGRQDVVIHYPSDGAAHRVAVLMTRGTPRWTASRRTPPCASACMAWPRAHF